MNQLLTENQTSELLNVSRSLLRKWRMERNNLPFIRLGGRIAYQQQDIEQFISSKTVKPISSDR